MSVQRSSYWKMILENDPAAQAIAKENGLRLENATCTSIGTQIQMHVILPAVRW
jgi:hypothetical protein